MRQPHPKVQRTTRACCVTYLLVGSLGVVCARSDFRCLFHPARGAHAVWPWMEEWPWLQTTEAAIMFGVVLHCGSRGRAWVLRPCPCLYFLGVYLTNVDTKRPLLLLSMRKLGLGDLRSGVSSSWTNLRREYPTHGNWAAAVNTGVAAAAVPRASVADSK